MLFRSDLTFEFEIAGSQSKEAISTPMADKNEEPETMLEKKVQPQVQAQPIISDPMDEQLRKSRERIQKLKALNYRMASNTNLADMEKVPAYVRKEVKLDNIPHSSEPHISRYTLSAEEEKKPELRQNNSYLHDNVD